MDTSVNFFVFDFCEVDFDNEIITWYPSGHSPKRENLIRRIMASDNWYRDFGVSIQAYVNKH